MERNETTGRTLKIVIPVVIVVLVMAFVFLCSIFSLNTWVSGKPGVNAERKVEGETSIMTMDYRPTLDVPILFSDLTITSLEDGEPLEERAITAGGYINTIELSHWIGAVGHFTDEELASRHLTAIDDTMVTKDSCIFLAFSEFPPIDCPIQIDISYRVLGIFPKTETVTHYWDAE